MDDLDNDLSGFLGISRDFGRTVAGNASQEEARMAVAVMLATARVLMMTTMSATTTAETGVAQEQGRWCLRRYHFSDDFYIYMYNHV